MNHWTFIRTVYSSMIYHIHAEFLPSTVVWIVHSQKNSHLESCFCRDDLFASLGPWNLSNKNEPPLERELFPTIQQANRRRWTLQMNDALEFEKCLAVSLKGVLPQRNMEGQQRPIGYPVLRGERMAVK